jgi:hypothetical protein
MVERLTDGMVLNLHTSDSIDPITGHETNPHIEKEMVLEVKKDFVILYSLTWQKQSKIEKRFMDLYLKRGIYEITDEKA